MRNEPIRVTPLSGAIGAEIGGVDLREDLDADTVAAIRRAWLDHCVVFFRDQPLDSGQFLAAAKRFGTAVEYPFVKGLPDHPEIIEVLKREDETVNFGGIWHTDTAYLDEPPMATWLIAREIPPIGGDTMFANQYLAYETLSDGMKAMLDGLMAVNSSAKADVTKTREDRVKDTGNSAARTVYEAEHPVVRTHPETGRKALYVNRGHTVRFAGMTEAESAPILQMLYQHAVRPELTCRFRWAKGSVAFWDNRCTQHFAVNDYFGQRREMHRVTICGDRPF